MDINQVKLFYNTVFYLKPTQVYYRVYYFIKNKFFSKKIIKRKLVKSNPVAWKQFIINKTSYVNKNNSFLFLNISHSFSEEIDWNYDEYGKLWTYNLNYFDFLNQKEISKKDGIKLIENYVQNDTLLTYGKESYPISLRGINWIKFLSKKQIKNQDFDNTLYNHYHILLNNLEYHLLGNHLLENAFSLLFGAYYFRHKEFYSKSKEILISELNEQILDDGGHFELSPMYHQIMLYRILDCIQLIKLNKWIDDDLINLLDMSASKMLSWLFQVTFKNGDIPIVNDSAIDIAPTTKELFHYGKLLGINKKNIKLSDSGYRMFKSDKYELFMDMGEVGASYQPGHVHSDTFNFVLYVNNQPFIVDTGTSTYEKNERRQLERSTSSHNTVTICDYDQTQIWGGFRVGKRAGIISLTESDNKFSSSHDGYKNIGIIHNRKFITNKDSVHIFDKLDKHVTYEKIAYFHFHPLVNNIIIKKTKVFFKSLNIEISFKGKNIFMKKELYKYACGFNKTENAFKLKVVFESNLETIIKL